MYKDNPLLPDKDMAITKKEPQMMICPSDRCTAYGTKETPHCRKHKATFSCFDPRRRKISLCPACIPVEPEQCPECGQKALTHEERVELSNAAFDKPQIL